ncbi:MAG: hypothetical protein WBA41_25540 [Rivularia sp. (in: cyanobacteria)]
MTSWLRRRNAFPYAMSHLFAIAWLRLKIILLVEVILSLVFAQLGTYYGACSISHSIVFKTFAPQHNTPFI